MRIAHTEEVRLFSEVTGVEQALTQQIVGTAKETYLADIRNRNTNYSNDAVAGVLTNLQENYGQLMLHEILEREDIVKKMIYNPREPIATVFSSVEEFLNFSCITGTLYTHIQAVGIVYAILHRTGKFGMSIHEWNRMPEIQKTRLQFKHFFRKSHQELRETSDITVEDAGMHHANITRDVVVGLQ